MVAVDILTGYLGAGKTTLLRYALAHGLDARRVVVVVNELGAVGIDGTVLEGPATVGRMLELTGGCLCCSLDGLRFERALQDLVDRVAPDLVVIETTGVADPLEVASRVRRLGFGLDAVTTVVDASALDRQLRADPVVARQIAAADFIVLSKTDLVTAGEVARARRRLRSLNPRATQSAAQGGAIDPALLFATGARGSWQRGDDDNGAASGGASRVVDAFVYRTPHALDLDRFARVLDGLPEAVLRGKGVLRIVGTDTSCIFNYVNGRHDVSWIRLGTTRESQAVFIGPDLREHEVAIRRALATCECAGASTSACA